ncbi:MAG: multiheme c-type cytochrome [Myxococcota bacterium]
MSETGIWTSRARRIMASLALVFLWVTLSAASCKRNTDTAVGSDPVRGATDEADTAEATTRPADAPSVSTAYEDVGPPAPAIFMITGMKGYYAPCGCTADVKAGGIDRMEGVLTQARAHHPAHLLLDGGNMLFEEPVIDERRVDFEKDKAQLVADAHRVFGTRMTVPGPNDFAMGTTYYRDTMQRVGITPRAINMVIDGRALGGVEVVELDGIQVGVVPVVDPEEFTEATEEHGATFTGVDTEPFEEPLSQELEALVKKDIDVIVVVFHGKAGAAKALLEAHSQVDFVMVGVPERETDQVDPMANGYTLEPFDQGRYLGILKLYAGDDARRARPLTNARPVSKADLDAVEKRIARVNEIINSLPPALQGEEPPLLKRQREALLELKRAREELMNTKIAVPQGVSAFLWRALRLEEGYPEDPKLTKAIAAFDRKTGEVEPGEVIPVEQGQAFFVGSPQCISCHAEAYALWETTAHAKAWETLEEQGKHTNPDCIGCHVVGYEQPGGSAIKNVQYPASNELGMEWTKDLRDVGCESCHGPGSQHMLFALKGQTAEAKEHIKLEGPAEFCASTCHVPEHSPRFQYETYIEEITGKGHELRRR